jgi:two-component system, chemotaxis family, chemotaxis protein CheY
MSYNFLIVDDSKTARMMLAKTLRISGIDIGEVFMASDVGQALSLLKDHWIDLVITDLHMPVMGGVEMLHSMAEDGLLESVPVVVVSSDASQTRREDLSRQGIRHYLCKPVRPEQVKSVVEGILELVP